MIIDTTQQGYFQMLLEDYKRKDGIEIKYSDFLTLSKIAPHEDNKFINDKTVFPATANLTDLIQLSQNSAESHISRKSSGWNYSNRLTIKNGEELNINNENYIVRAATIRNITKRTMIIENTKIGNLATIDLKNLDNLDELYQILEKKSLDQKNKSKSSFKIG